MNYFDPAYFDAAFFETAEPPEERRVDPRIMPPSIHDARTAAFAEVMRRALAEPRFKRLLMELFDHVDPRLLPFLIREYGLQDFIEPDMSEVIIRRLLKGSFALHRQMGFITGVRTGLSMLGVSVTSWSQWFQQSPQGAPGTHVATVSVGEEVFVGEGSAITSRLQRTLGRMVARMQRKSQFVALRFAATGPTGSRAPVHVGASVVTRLRVRPSVEPITTLTARPPLFVGAAVTSRFRISPRIA